jgi:hypothetical protein
MSGLIRTEDGFYVPESEIVGLRKNGDTIAITTKNGQTYYAQNGYETLELAKAYSGPPIPAIPGYFVIAAFIAPGSDEGWGHNLFPVVGWSRLGTYCDSGVLFGSAPIVAGMTEHADKWAIVMPDGVVITPQGGVYPNPAEWLDDVKSGYEFENNKKSNKKGKKKSKK